MASTTTRNTIHSWALKAVALYLPEAEEVQVASPVDVDAYIIRVATGHTGAYIQGFCASISGIEARGDPVHLMDLIRDKIKFAAHEWRDSPGSRWQEFAAEVLSDPPIP